MTPWRAIVAPVLLGACVAAPPTKTADETPRTVRPPELSAKRVEVPPDEPGEPLRGVEEAVLPKLHVKSFTRRVERARIDAQGVQRLKAGVQPAASAVKFDNDTWKGDQRRELLAYLRGEAVEKDATFTEDDARIVAQLQAGSGALADGALRDETMAVLFAMGFRFSPRKAMLWEVRLDLYPGEVEDLDAWSREIETKITKNGGDYRSLSAPAGEGTIYVHVGRSIVASYRARGGPPSSISDEGEHTAGPTKPGVYRLGPAHAHVTSNWYYSQIPWGAEIRKKDDGYQYRSPGSPAWLWATSPGSTLKLPLGPEAFEDLPAVTRDGVTYLVWNMNDFGPLAWNLVPSDQYLHTTPEAEHEAETDGDAQDPDTSLSVSHGCVHIYPHDRDEMMKLGYVGANVLFVVRRWDEHLLPDPLRHEMLGR